MTSKELGTWKKAALLAADWFVNSQEQINRPSWNANAGRFIYNYHFPSKTRVSGLNWTQGRGIMVLMAAYRLTGKKKYLDSARFGAQYLNSLMEFDRIQPYYGAFHEEIPQSDKCWPRDGAEGASGYLHLHNEAPDADLVRRARIYADWMLTTNHPKEGIPPAFYYFDKRPKVFQFDYYTVGSGMMYALLYQATGGRNYLHKGLKPLIDKVDKRFVDPRDNAFISAHAVSHHSGKDKSGRLLVLNDDGLGAALLSGALLMNNGEYARTAVKIADWLMTQTQKVDRACTLPNRLCYLLDIARFTGLKKYRDYVEKRIPEVLSLQMLKQGDPNAFGGFRGEDEVIEWYKPGARKYDFVTTRTSCYAALTLFKLVNPDWTPGYSAFGWKRS